MKKVATISWLLTLVLGVWVIWMQTGKLVMQHVSGNTGKSNLVYAIADDIASPAESHVVGAPKVIATGWGSSYLGDTYVTDRFIKQNRYYTTQYFGTVIKWLVESPIFIQIRCLRL